MCSGFTCLLYRAARSVSLIEQLVQMDCPASDKGTTSQEVSFSLGLRAEKGERLHDKENKNLMGSASFQRPDQLLSRRKNVQLQKEFQTIAHYF